MSWVTIGPQRCILPSPSKSRRRTGWSFRPLYVSSFCVILPGIWKKKGEERPRRLRHRCLVTFLVSVAVAMSAYIEPPRMEALPHDEIACLAWPDEVMVPGQRKIIHLYEARFLLLLEQVRKEGLIHVV